MVKKKAVVKNRKKTATAKPRGKPFQKGKSGNPAGRPKGSKNKTPQLLQQLFLDTLFKFEKKDGLTIYDWAKQNRTEFMRIVARILPKAVDVSGDVDLNHTIRWQK